MPNYNTQIAKIGGLINSLASEITNHTELKKGEKFLLLQRIFLELKPLEKNFKKLESEIKQFAFENLHDTGENQSEPAEFEGAEVLVKYSYPKPTLNAEKLKEDFKNIFDLYQEYARDYAELYAEINGLPKPERKIEKFDENQYLKESTPRKKVIIQSILNK